MEWEQAKPEYMKGSMGLAWDEKITFLFQPDTLLSAQYFAHFRRNALLAPEKRLMLAILEEAIKCFQENLLTQTGRSNRLFEEAKHWVIETDKDWIFSFESICETLGINPAYLRQGLLRWKEKQLAKRTDPKVWERRKMTG